LPANNVGDQRRCGVRRHHLAERVGRQPDNEPQIARLDRARYGVLDPAVGIDGVAVITDTDTELSVAN
jgi:hypothetical protein